MSFKIFWFHQNSGGERVFYFFLGISGVIFLCLDMERKNTFSIKPPKVVFKRREITVGHQKNSDKTFLRWAAFSGGRLQKIE